MAKKKIQTKIQNQKEKQKYDLPTIFKYFLAFCIGVFTLACIVVAWELKEEFDERNNELVNREKVNHDIDDDIYSEDDKKDKSDDKDY